MVKSKTSIIIPVFNTEKYLKACLDSVVNQTHSNIEIIVINDGSTDDSGNICQGYAENDSRITFIDKDNEGVSITRNIGILNAKGDFITGLDDDDDSRYDRLELFLEKWKVKCKKTRMLYSLYSRKIDNDLVVNRLKKFNLKKKVGMNNLLYFFYTGNQIFTTKELLQKYFFDFEMPAWQDFECYYRFLKKYKCHAELVPFETYVVDVSHIYERISTKDISNIKNAFNIFKDKHSLSGKEANLLYCHLYNYPNIRISKFRLLKIFAYKPSILGLKWLINIGVVK